MDQLQSMRAFVRVVEEGGFSAAARSLNVSKATVSDQVQALEKLLGARLLNRTSRQVSATEIGREYYERCVQVLNDLYEADQAAGALRATPRGRLKVYCHQGGIGRFIAPAVIEFTQQHPEVWVDMRVGDALVDLTQEGFDLAVSPLAPPTSQLLRRKLAAWSVVVCCSPTYLNQHPAPRHPADLIAHNCVRNPYTVSPDEWHFIDAQGGAVAVKVSGNLVTTSIDAMRCAAVAGAGIVLVPPFIVSDLLASGALVTLLPDYRTPTSEIVALYPERRHMTAKTRAFIDLLVARFASEQRWLVPQ